MPRFFFHVRSHEGLDRDPEGADFDDIEDARMEAIKAARELMGAKVAQGELINGESFEVADANGKVVAVVPFRSVIRFQSLTAFYDGYLDCLNRKA